MPRIASLSPHELRGCTLRVTLTTLLRLRLESRQIRADSCRSYEGCRKSENLECRRAVRHWRGGPFVFCTLGFLALSYGAGTGFARAFWLCRPFLVFLNEMDFPPNGV